MALLNQQDYVEPTKHRWLDTLGPRRLKTGTRILEMFTVEICDPVELIFEARRIQDSGHIQNALTRFYQHLVTRGLSEETAWEYVTIIHSLFSANRIPLAKMRRPELSTSISSPL